MNDTNMISDRDRLQELFNLGVLVGECCSLSEEINTVLSNIGHETIIGKGSDLHELRRNLSMASGVLQDIQKANTQ